MSNMAKLEMQGAEALMKALDEIIAEDGPKSLNKAMRQATRAAVKEIVLPRVRELVPHDTGDLESQLTVRAIRRARGKLGHTVGLKNAYVSGNSFQGDGFYGGFLEFGFKHRGGTQVPADSFLRRGLYESEQRVRAAVENELKSFVRQANRRVPNKL